MSGSRAKGVMTRTCPHPRKHRIHAHWQQAFLLATGTGRTLNQGPLRCSRKVKVLKSPGLETPRPLRAALLCRLWPHKEPPLGPLLQS